ncbi:putative nuclease HARBI1 [Hydra vulgaris]|uniref:putative nuclease HARBI1 n=1 Tax=Hydra vulgaris TaxID=6087 RepID=UPI0032E9D909
MNKYWTESDWVANIRMSKEAFIYLCSELEIFIKTKDTNFRKNVSVEQKDAEPCIFFFGSSDIRTISNLFGLGCLTVCQVIQLVTNAIVDNLLKIYIYLPQEAEVKEIMKQFEDMSTFPLIVGAVDGCHIRIKAPKKNPEDYINRKDYHSIILQGFVDSRYIF